VRLWISATDYQVARLGCLGPTGFGGDRAAEYFASHGLNSPQAMEQIKGRTGYFPSLVPSVPPQYRRLMDGMALAIGGREWRCISGYGHAPEHIALYCAELNVLIGGDMMLPRISTNVSVYEQEPEANALVQFLESIDKFRALPEDTLVLPSHGKPFTGMHIRIQQLHDHHRDRLAEVMEACATVDRSPLRYRIVLELPAQLGIVGHYATHGVPEAGAVVHDTQVAQLVDHDIVDDRRAKMDEAPVQADGAIRLRAAPTGACVAQAEPGPLHLQLRSKMGQSLQKILTRLAHQPGLHRIADLLRRGRLGQANP
jgi:glyoxylase-like metal-dependent hydrolase (beta-lactamase superfamily II)